MCKQQFYALHKYYKIYLDEKQKMVCAFFEIPWKFTGWNAWRALSPVSGNPAHRSVGISVLCSAQPVLCHNSENCNTVNCWTVCNKHFQVPSLLNKSIFSRYSSDFLIYCFFFFSKLFPLQRNDWNLSYYHLPEMLFLLFLLLPWGTPISDPSRILQFSFL